MSKSSTISARQYPARDLASSGGRLRIHTETLTIETAARVELVDVTDRLTALVRSSHVADGLMSVWSMHTTCALFINENQTALHADIRQFLEQTVSREGKWLHNDPDHSDCDRNNADAHLRAMLLGHSMTLQIAGGEPVLGQWQRVLAAELDGPRTRTFRIHIQGIEAPAATAEREDARQSRAGVGPPRAVRKDG